MAGLGQPFFGAPLPNGWPDTAADWAGGRRRCCAASTGPTASPAAPAARDPAAVADASLGPLLPAATLRGESGAPARGARP